MATPKKETTTKVEQTGMGLSFKSANPDAFPIAYSDEVWDVADEDSALADAMGAEGQFDQSAVNERMAFHAGQLDRYRYGRVYPTVAAMAAAINVPDGYVAFCTATGLHYDYKSSRTADPTLGKWRDTDGAATYLEHEWNLMELTDPGLRQQIMQGNNRIYIVRNSPVTPFTLTNTGASAATFQMVKTAGTGDTIGMWQYSLDGGTTWQALATVSTAGSENGVTVAAGASVQIRAVDYVPTIYVDSTDRYQLLLYGTSWSASGNVMSLLYRDYHDRFTIEEPYALAFLFYRQSALTDISGLALPATVLSAGCYCSMFEGTGIASIPVLPALSVPAHAYSAMFRGCTALEFIRPLTIAAVEASGAGCMESMFEGCTGLASVECLYVVRATGEQAMASMFAGDEALIDCTMPYLTMANAPEALASMFDGCLTFADLTVGLTYWPTSGNADTLPTLGWLADVFGTGTFRAPMASTAVARDADHVPADWTIVTL